MINLKSKDLDTLQTIFRDYCPDAEIWAYGSRVNGDSHSGSDLDLTVKSFNDSKKRIYELKELLSESNITFLIDINSFDLLPYSFQEEIKRSYVVIFPDSKALRELLALP